MSAARPLRAWWMVVPAAMMMVVVVALVEAAICVELQGGFGRGDLVALGVWSLPFGGVVAAAALVLRRARRPQGRALRTLVGVAVGAALGLLWTWMMVQMMGPWFGTFSFPVLPILAVAAALTLVVFVAPLRKPAVAPPG